MKNNSDKKTLGIYVHIPFCVQKCKYCDFCSFASLGAEMKSEYKNALTTDVFRAAEHFKDRTVDSVFFGGGTPTCLPAEHLCDILKAIFDNYNVSNEAEITLECNPATADKDYFDKLISAGFNRLSMGAQSVHDGELSALGRIHSVGDVKITYADARAAGFGNINLDLMYGIPHQSLESFSKTLDAVLSLSPEHISAYSLKIEPGTEFYRNRDKLVLPDEDEEYAMYKLADEKLSAAGYEHYEISNYAKSGYKSRHNLKYWSLDEYVGFGVASHSLIGGTRYSVTDSIKKYVDYFKDADSHSYYEVEERLSKKALTEEYLMMRLRLSDGLSPNEYERKFGASLDKKYLERIEPFIKSGHVRYRDGAYRFTADGMYVSNYILSEILDLDE